ncbi:hypothetical protein Tco_0730087 [Tanacetum coccineum]|uniref:Retrovirus-related Pol polyprotein from transposon TNT 1-94 n=1 Tax=Tanacetum coccineum TaxID=301880 RepID=A0ABQ4YT77_9ASTR
MHSSKSLFEHIDEFHKLVGDLAAIDTAISYEDHALLLLKSLPSSYNNFVETLLYVWDTLKLEDVMAGKDEGFAGIAGISRSIKGITKEKTAAWIWKKLETLYMIKSLANHLYLKKRLYNFNMHSSKSLFEHIDEFHKLVGDLAAIDTAISYEDHTLLLLKSLPSSYNNFVETLLYVWVTLKLEDVLSKLNSRELQKMTNAKGDGGEGLYVRGRFGQRDMEHVSQAGRWLAAIDTTISYEDHALLLLKSLPSSYDNFMETLLYVWDTLKLEDGRSNRLKCCIYQSKEHLKRVCPISNHKKSQGFVRNKDQVFGFGAHEYDNADVMMVMSVEELGYNHVYIVNRSPSLAIGFKTPIDMLRFFSWLSSTKKGMLEPVKVKCVFLGYRKGMMGNKLWRLHDVTSKVVLYKNMGFNESEECKKTFIGSGVGTCSVQVL